MSTVYNEFLERIISDRHNNVITKEIVNIIEAYNSSKKKGYNLIVFREVVWENSVSEYIKILRKAGIKKIVIASNQSGLTKVLYIFKEKGCRIGELVDLSKPINAMETQINDECYGFYINL